MEDGGSDDDDDFEVDLDWEKLGWEYLGKSRRVPGMDFMLGPLSIEQKKRTTQKRAKADKFDAPLTKPKEMTEEEMKPGDLMGGDVQLVAQMNVLLEDQGHPVNVFRFCINPESFSQSVENLFYLSFLIRDCKAALDVDEEGDLLVYPCEAPEPEEGGEALVKRQGVWQLDEETWQLAIETYNITEPMFPTRPVPAEHNYAFYGR